MSQGAGLDACLRYLKASLALDEALMVVSYSFSVGVILWTDPGLPQAFHLM